MEISSRLLHSSAQIYIERTPGSVRKAMACHGRCLYRMSGDMFLPRGNLAKQVSLYPLAKSITEVQDVTWFDKGPSDGEISQPIFTIDQIGSLKQPSKENQITIFLCDVEPTIMITQPTCI